MVIISVHASIVRTWVMFLLFFDKYAFLWFVPEVVFVRAGSEEEEDEAGPGVYHDEMV